MTDPRYIPGDYPEYPDGCTPGEIDKQWGDEDSEGSHGQAQ